MDSEIVKDLHELLDLHFPDEPSADGPYWQQDEYRQDLSNLAVRAKDIINAGEVVSVVQEWKNHRTHGLPKDQNSQVDQIVNSWDRWQRQA